MGNVTSRVGVTERRLDNLHDGWQDIPIRRIFLVVLLATIIRLFFFLSLVDAGKRLEGGVLGGKLG